MAAAETAPRPDVQKAAMKTLRSVNRRSFSIETAGGYTFLRPSERFIPAHPPGDFRYLANLYKGTAFPQVHVNPATAPQFELIPSPYQNDPLYLRLLRPALFVLAVLALIYFYW
jgi:hypothetical protein